MYINVNFAEKNGLSPTDIIYLQVVNQNRTEDLQSYLNKMLPSIVAKRYTTTIKSGETRLNKEGKELLIKLQTPNYNENDDKLADFLIEKYKEENLNVCSRTKLLKLIAWFRAETSLTHKEIYKLIVSYFESEESKYNKRLDYLFWKPVNAYSVQKLSDSRLYNWYESNMEMFNFDNK